MDAEEPLNLNRMPRELIQETLAQFKRESNRDVFESNRRKFKLQSASGGNRIYYNNDGIFSSQPAQYVLSLHSRTQKR